MLRNTKIVCTGLLVKYILLFFSSIWDLIIFYHGSVLLKDCLLRCELTASTSVQSCILSEELLK